MNTEFYDVWHIYVKNKINYGSCFAGSLHYLPVPDISVSCYENQRHISLKNYIYHFQNESSMKSSLTYTTIFHLVQILRRMNISERKASASSSLLSRIFFPPISSNSSYSLSLFLSTDGAPLPN